MFQKKGTKSNGLNIEGWYQAQKVKFLLMKGVKHTRRVKPLENWQLKLLNEIDFLFENKLDEEWKMQKKEFIKIQKLYDGKIPVKEPNTNKPYKIHNIDLKRWVTKQRTRKLRNTLEQWKIDELEKIPHWTWDPFQEAFDSNLKALIAYIKETNNPNPGQGVVFDDIRIGSFLTRLRTGRYETLFTNKIKKQLEDLGTNFKPTKKIGNVIYYK